MILPNPANLININVTALMEVHV